MNKTSMPHVDYTWNPFTGCTLGCKWCYAAATYKRFGRDFAPQFHLSRLNQPKSLKRPSLIFCGSAGDIADQETSVLNDVLEVMWDTPQHQYLMLTKRPNELDCPFMRKRKPDNLWLGVSVTNQDEYERRVSDLLASCFPMMKMPHGLVVSIEPMLGAVNIEEFAPYTSWIIVGGLSSGQPLHKKSKEHAMMLTQLLYQSGMYGIPVMYKHSGKHLPVIESVDEANKAIVEHRYDCNPMRDALLGAGRSSYVSYTCHYLNIVRNCKGRSTEKCWINGRPCSFCTDSTLIKFCNESLFEVALVISKEWKDVYVPVVKNGELYRHVWAGSFYLAKKIALSLGKGNPSRKELGLLSEDVYAIVRDLAWHWRAHKKPTTLNLAEPLEVSGGTKYDNC